MVYLIIVKFTFRLFPMLYTFEYEAFYKNRNLDVTLVNKNLLNQMPFEDPPLYFDDSCKHFPPRIQAITVSLTQT